MFEYFGTAFAQICSNFADVIIDVRQGPKYECRHSLSWSWPKCEIVNSKWCPR